NNDVYSLSLHDALPISVPMRELLGDDAQPQTEADDAGEPDDAHQDRVPVEVALRDRRAGQVGRDAAAEHAGQAAALAPVQQDQRSEEHTSELQSRVELV